MFILRHQKETSFHVKNVYYLHNTSSHTHTSTHVYISVYNTMQSSAEILVALALPFHKRRRDDHFLITLYNSDIFSHFFQRYAAGEGKVTSDDVCFPPPGRPFKSIKTHKAPLRFTPPRWAWAPWGR